MLPDLRHAVRSLAKSPGHTAIALVTLALGIGLNTSMFSLVNTLLFRTAPYPEAERVVRIAGPIRGAENRSAFSHLEFEEVRPVLESLGTFTATQRASYAWAEPGRPAERIGGGAFSANMMETFRVQPMLGRAFLPDEFTPGKGQVVLLSEYFWRARFAADPAVLGKTMRLDGDTLTIIGVMPASFDYRLLWGNVSVWRPISLTPDQLRYRGYRSFNFIGRLNPGITPADVALKLAPTAARQEKEFPQDYPNLRYRADLLHEALMDGTGRGISWMLLGLAGFVLLIACANLANLQLARAIVATRDFAIRAALGASRTRLIAHQLTESLLLSVVGGALGFIVALWVNHLFETNILLDGVPGLELPIDRKILFANLAISVCTGALFGVAPALFASRTDVNAALKQQSRGSTGGRGQHRMRQALIVAEVALALVLLGGAAIVHRGFQKFIHRETGWDASRVLTGVLLIPENRFPTRENRMELFRRIEARLSSVSGVEGFALATSVPLFGYSADRQVFLDLPVAGSAQGTVASHVMITPGYFAAMGIPVLEGRNFLPDVKTDGPQEILVNESLARRLWPNQSALGKRLAAMDNGQPVWREVIGVTRDVQSAANFTNLETRYHVYRPLVQEAWSYVNLVVRAQNPAALIEPIRHAMSEVDADLPAEQLGTVPQFIDRTQHNMIVISHTLVGFAALGLLLAAVGLYGVISSLVVQRTAEFGIRMALGAQPIDVLRNVIQRGAGLTLVGIVLGLAGAYGVGRFLGSIMPRIALADPLGLAAMAVLLFATALLACWVPARRATKVNPIIALRAE